MSTMATHGVLSLPPGPRSDSGRGSKAWNLEHQYSIIDDLLFEIYDRWHDGKHDSFESDTFTECSSTSEAFHWRRSSIHSDTHTNSGRLLQASLETQSVEQLRKLVSELQHRTNFMSTRLVRQLKRRERRQNKLQHNCDIVTAILQAASQKRHVFGDIIQRFMSFFFEGHIFKNKITLKRHLCSAYHLRGVVVFVADHDSIDGWIVVEHVFSEVSITDHKPMACCQVKITYVV